MRYHKGTNDEAEYRDFSPLEFLAQLTQFILNPSEQSTRYYGLASARTRGALRKSGSALNAIYNCYKPDPLAEDSPASDTTESDLPSSALINLLDNCPLPERRPISRYWAHWIGKIYEVDPLECPKCQGRMKVKAIIHKTTEIKKICKHLGIVDWQPVVHF